MRRRPCWCAIRRKPLLTPLRQWRVGRAAVRSRKSGTTQPPTPSRTSSAPPCAASSNPRAAAVRFPPAAATRHFEEAMEVEEVKDVEDTRECDLRAWLVGWKSFTSFTSYTSFTSFLLTSSYPPPFRFPP